MNGLSELVADFTILVAGTSFYEGISVLLIISGVILARLTIMSILVQGTMGYYSYTV